MPLNDSKMNDSTSLPVFPSSVLKVVCVSDTHGDDPSERVPGGDILIHAGDITDHSRVEDFQNALNWISSLPHKVKIIVAGEFY